MPSIPFHNIGSFGIVRDVPAHELPPEAWSDGKNVRFKDNKVEKYLGHSAVFGTPGITPNWAMAVPTSTLIYWLYASLTQVFTYDGTTHTEITRASGNYSVTAKLLWNGGLLGNIPILNNGTDPPQFWSPVAPATKLSDLTNWPAATSTRVIRPFKNFLIAMGVTKSGTVFDHLVKWSHPAAPGAVPSSWDETDATKDAGEKELEDTQAGLIRDGMTLGDLFIIYKDQSTWAMQHIRGEFIFRFFKLFDTIGILSTDCVAPFARRTGGRQHFVATGDDLIIHNGQSVSSVIDKRFRRFILDNLDQDNFDRSFVVPNRARHEMLFCFPEVGSTLPSLAITWNYSDNTVGVRELSNTSFIAPGIISGVVDTSWDADTGTWDSDLTFWDEQAFKPFALDLLMCDPTNTKLYQFDKTNQLNGTNMTSFVERTGLALVGQDRQGNPKVDMDRRKLVKRIWPKAEGGPLLVKVGSQEQVGGAVTWSAEKSFTPGTDQFVDLIAQGRLLAVHFRSTTDVDWKLHSYDLDIELLGVH